MPYCAQVLDNNDHFVQAGDKYLLSVFGTVHWGVAGCGKIAGRLRSARLLSPPLTPASCMPRGDCDRISMSGKSAVQVRNSPRSGSRDGCSATGCRRLLRRTCLPARRLLSRSGIGIQRRQRREICQAARVCPQLRQLSRTGGRQGGATAGTHLVQASPAFLLQPLPALRKPLVPHSAWLTS